MGGLENSIFGSISQIICACTKISECNTWLAQKACRYAPPLAQAWKPWWCTLSTWFFFFFLVSFLWFWVSLSSFLLLSPLLEPSLLFYLLSVRSLLGAVAVTPPKKKKKHIQWLCACMYLLNALINVEFIHAWDVCLGECLRCAQEHSCLLSNEGSLL